MTIWKPHPKITTLTGRPISIVTRWRVAQIYSAAIPPRGFDRGAPLLVVFEKWGLFTANASIVFALATMAAAASK